MSIWKWVCTIATAGALSAAAVAGQAADVRFVDPAGDDVGHGAITYPLDSVYTKGSFDLAEFRVTETGELLRLEFDLVGKLKDKWGTGKGFDVQMFMVFIDYEKGGRHVGTPGLDLRFARGSGWDRAIAVSSLSEDQAEASKSVTGSQASRILVARNASGNGRTITAYVPRRAIPTSTAPGSWGYQVVVQSTEGFPVEGAYLTRAVQQVADLHRFGGGKAGDCDPQAIDILGSHAQLNHSCGLRWGVGARHARLTMQRSE
ncbi:MAG: hypothetical protein OXH76_19460 [Boseongicola sp.]|nr:hypothetical protein [Boseongicola sp.]